MTRPAGTYNSWNLPESQIEPSTAAYSSPAQGTFTAAYDASGRLATVTQPGGVTLADTYNSAGELTGQSGSGADAATATRSFGYDLAGGMTSASTSAAGPAPATSESFSYNDRGLPLSASGSGGSSSFTYNGDGAPVSVTDAAGTTSYTYDNAGRLATLADPLTGTTAAYSYSPMSQVSQISYGSGNDVRAFGYNNLHQLTSDALTTAGGASVASIGYGYDLNGNLTSKTTTGFAGPAANTYTYDEANRLTSWNNGSTATDYSYDGAGNLTQAGGQTLTYDARDELTSSQPGSGGATTFSYTARGTMSSATGPNGTQSFASDAYGQGVTQAGQQYTYDALGRVLTGSGNGESFSFGYDGTGSQITADGTWDYSYDPGGGLAAVGPSGGSAGQGVIAYTDAHTDVTGDFSPSAASLTGSAAYDPFGNVLASSGLAGNLGYQSGFTDPASRLVHMGARWYSPADGQFTSRDSVTVSSVPDEAAANPFAYAADNPLTSTDPTGHFLAIPGGGGVTRRVPVRHYYSPPPPPARSCGGLSSWLSPGCFVHHVSSMYKHAVSGYHRAVKLVTHVAHVIYGGAYRALQHLRALQARAVHFAGHLARAVQTKIADAASWGYHAAATAWDTGVSAGSRVVHAVTRWAAPYYQKAVHIVHTAVHAGVSFAKGFASVLTGVARGAVMGAIAQARGTVDNIGGCVTGHLRSCLDTGMTLLDQVTGVWVAQMAVKAAVGGVAAAKSVYGNYAAGHYAYATGQLTAYAAMIAATRGDGLAADTGAAATAADLAPGAVAGASQSLPGMTGVATTATRSDWAIEQGAKASEFDETTYSLGHAAENTASTVENFRTALEPPEVSGAMTRVPSGHPVMGPASSMGAADPLSAMFVNGALATRTIWTAVRAIFGGGE